MGLDLIVMLQAELNMHSLPAGRSEQLQRLLTAAQSRIQQTGITPNLEDVADCQLVVDYAAWMWRRRAQTSTAQMPAYLSLDIRNRLVAEKGRVSNGEA